MQDDSDDEVSSRNVKRPEAQPRWKKPTTSIPASAVGSRKDSSSESGCRMYNNLLYFGNKFR